MSSFFKKGDVIATHSDPLHNDFHCGTVWEASNGKCTIWIMGGGMMTVPSKDIVSLRDVITLHPDVTIIAEKDRIERSRIFVGGRVIGERALDGKSYHVHASGAICYIAHNNAMPAIAALQILEPCPRSRFR